MTLLQWLCQCQPYVLKPNTHCRVAWGGFQTCSAGIDVASSFWQAAAWGSQANLVLGGEGQRVQETCQQSAFIHLSSWTRMVLITTSHASPCMQAILIVPLCTTASGSVEGWARVMVLPELSRAQTGHHSTCTGTLRS